MEKKAWEFDRKVPVTVVAALVLQLIVFGVLWGNIENRMTNLERQVVVVSALPVQVGRLEERITAISASLERIEQKIDRRNGKDAK